MIININKPAGITSHDVVDVVRRITGERRVGHAGTLDPFATGLLIMAVGREATREISKFVGMDKTYEAEIVLGATTPSLDPETEVIFHKSVPAHRRVEAYSHTPLRLDEIKAAATALTSDLLQIPPMYSAIKIGGRRLYKAARKGETIAVKPRPITVYTFDIINTSIEVYCDTPLQIVKAKVNCSSGTYVRALARDLAQKLGTLGFLRSLRRTTIGNFHVKNSSSLTIFNSKNWPRLY